MKESDTISNKLSKEIKMRKQYDPIIDLDIGHKILNKVLSSVSPVERSMKAPELDNFMDYAPDGIEDKSVQKPMVEYTNKKFNPQPNNTADTKMQNYNTIKSQMTTIYDEKNNADSHSNFFKDVSDRPVDIGNPNDWQK